jgi:hypothetical protein
LPNEELDDPGQGAWFLSDNDLLSKETKPCQQINKADRGLRGPANQSIRIRMKTTVNNRVNNATRVRAGRNKNKDRDAYPAAKKKTARQ